MVPYILFFLAGVGFGYAAPGRAKLLPFLFPLLLALGAAVGEGVDVVALIVALVLTGIGIVAGAALEERQGQPA